jgi:hypothetical protein
VSVTYYKSRRGRTRAITVAAEAGRVTVRDVSPNGAVSERVAETSDPAGDAALIGEELVEDGFTRGEAR